MNPPPVIGVVVVIHGCRFSFGEAIEDALAEHSAHLLTGDKTLPLHVEDACLEKHGAGEMPHLRLKLNRGTAQPPWFAYRWCLAEFRAVPVSGSDDARLHCPGQHLLLALGTCYRSGVSGNIVAWPLLSYEQRGWLLETRL